MKKPVIVFASRGVVQEVLGAERWFLVDEDNIAAGDDQCPLCGTQLEATSIKRIEPTSNNNSNAEMVEFVTDRDGVPVSKVVSVYIHEHKQMMCPVCKIDWMDYTFVEVYERVKDMFAAGLLS
jgi:hypothetical protein